MPETDAAWFLDPDNPVRLRHKADKDSYFRPGTYIHQLREDRDESFRRGKQLAQWAQEARDVLADVRKLLEPYPIKNFSVTHSMYSSKWEHIGALLDQWEGRDEAES